MKCKYRVCPECRSKMIVTERRLGGKSKCIDCEFVNDSKYFGTFETSNDSEQLEFIVDWKEEISKTIIIKTSSIVEAKRIFEAGDYELMDVMETEIVNVGEVNITSKSIPLEDSKDYLWYNSRGVPVEVSERLFNMIKEITDYIELDSYGLVCMTIREEK